MTNEEHDRDLMQIDAIPGRSLAFMGGNCEACGLPMRRHDGWVRIDHLGYVTECSEREGDAARRA